MALALYLEPNPDTKVASDNPFAITFDGRRGGKINKRLYIRNDSAKHYYTNLSVSVVDDIAPTYTDASVQETYWKLAEKDKPLSHAEWQQIAPGNTLSVTSSIGTSSLASTSLYLPFWVHVSMREGFPIQNITNIKVRINATEILVNG